MTESFEAVAHPVRSSSACTVYVDIGACGYFRLISWELCYFFLWMSQDNLCECASGYRIVPCALGALPLPVRGYLRQPSVCNVHAPLDIFDGGLDSSLCSPGNSVAGREISAAASPDLSSSLPLTHVLPLSIRFGHSQTYQKVSQTP